MMIDVHLADGRTIFRLKKRGHFIDLIGRDLTALDSTSAQSCWVRWYPEEEFVPCRIMSVRKQSVAFTREIVGEERQEFDRKFPPPVNERRIRFCPIHKIVIDEGPCPLCASLERV